MSDIETKEFLKIVKVSFDLSPKIVRAYTRAKVLTPKFKGSLCACLDSFTVKHNIYHACKVGEKCCACNNQHKRPFNKSAQEWILAKLYNKDVNDKCNNPSRNCVCVLHAKENITLEELDLPVLIVILHENGEIHQDIEKLSSLRNKICHAYSTKFLPIEKYRDIWRKLENSIIAIARLADPSLYDLVKDQIKDLQKLTFDHEDVVELNAKVVKYMQLVSFESRDIKQHVSAEICTVNESLQQVKKEVHRSIKEESQRVIAAVEEKILPLKEVKEEHEAGLKRYIDGKAKILLDAIHTMHRNSETHPALYNSPLHDYSKIFLKTEVEAIKESDQESTSSTDNSDSFSESGKKKMKFKDDEKTLNEYTIYKETDGSLIDTVKTKKYILTWEQEIEGYDREIRNCQNVVRRLENPKVLSLGDSHIRLLSTKSRLSILKQRRQKKKKLIKASELLLKGSQKDLHTETDVFGLTNDSLMCISCKATSEENVVCWCMECTIVLCDSCSIQHKISTKDHTIEYSPNMAHGYTLESSFKIESFFGMIEDVKFVSRDNIVMLNVWNEQLLVCHLDGTNQQEISLDLSTTSAMQNQDLQMSHQVAVINDTIVAVSLCRYRAVVLVDIIKGRINKKIPITGFTGGITVMNNRLFVSAETKVLEANISINMVELNPIMNVSDTKILFSADGVNLYCVNYNQRISCFNMNGQQLKAFSISPFNFQSMTLDDEKNILFMDGSNVKQMRRDGKNTKTVITLPKPEDHSNYESTAICWISSLKYLIITRYDTVYVYKKT